MELRSRLLEMRRFMDKNLICDIKVQEIAFPVLGLQILTNKWLHLEDWLEIDASIERLLKNFYHSETLEGFEADVFYIGDAIRVDCRKVKVSKKMKKIFGADKVYVPVSLDIRVAKIDVKTLIAQKTHLENELRQLAQNRNLLVYQQQQAQAQAQAPAPAPALALAPAPAPIAIESNSDREYEPSLMNANSENNSVEYIPYNPSSDSQTDMNSSATNANEPYSPRPVLFKACDAEADEQPSDIPIYKPARIAFNEAEHVHDNDDDDDMHGSDDEEETPEETLPSIIIPKRYLSADEGNPETSANHTQLRTKQIRNAELFGSEDSDEEKPQDQVPSMANNSPQMPVVIKISTRPHKNKHKRRRSELIVNSCSSLPYNNADGRQTTPDERVSRNKSKPSPSTERIKTLKLRKRPLSDVAMEEI